MKQAKRHTAIRLLVHTRLYTRQDRKILCAFHVLFMASLKLCVVLIEKKLILILLHVNLSIVFYLFVCTL